MFCPKCKNELNDNAKFCSKCGCKLEHKNKTAKAGIKYLPIIVTVALLVTTLACFVWFLLIKAKQPFETNTLSPDRVTQLKKFDSYCGWRGQDENNTWAYGEAYSYFNKKETEHPIYYIRQNDKYIAIDEFTLTPCLSADDGRKVYYGDIVSTAADTSNGCSNYFDNGEKINAVATSQLCFTNESYYPKGPECHAEGYVVKDGVYPNPDTYKAKITDYPAARRNRITACEDNPELVCTDEHEILPGFPTWIDESFKVIGNIYDDEKVLESLSGLGKSASTYFSIPTSDIGSIPRNACEMP